MPEGPSSDDVAKVLVRYGFALVHQRGPPREVRTRGEPTRVVIVPMGRKNLKIGTFWSICRQAGLQPYDF